MRVSRRAWAVALLGIILAQPLHAQVVRLVNGASVSGEVVGVTEEGLQVRTATGVRTFTWDSLAPNTRFRYQALYRANYDGVLRGIPRARWSNAPDPVFEAEIRTLVKPAASSPPAQTPVSKPSAAETQPRESWCIFENLSFANVELLEARSFPGATFRDFEHSSFIGFQYGASATDVVYFAFDTAGPAEPSDVLFVYSPGTAEFTNTVKIKGFKKGSGADRRVTYRKLRMTCSIGKAQAIFELEPETTGLTTNELFLTVTVDLIREKERSRFILYRHFTDLVHGDGNIPVTGLLDLPNLWVGCEVKPGTTGRATLLLSMANMLFVPREGMDTRAALTVTDSAGNVVYRDNVKMDLIPPPVEGVVAELRRTVPGQTYKVAASMNLGPFLGMVEGTDTLTLPAK